MEKFEDLGISKPILKSIEKQGFEQPTEIQEKTIKLVIDQKDVIAEAATGSGKTLAFGSGIIQNSQKDFGIQSLVLTPTRELAEQVANEIKKFSEFQPLEIDAVYGGVAMSNQIKRLAYSDVVVGTPGRILDHIQRKTIDLANVKTLVLDEADRMLDMGFRDDVEKIIKQCPIKRQTLLFSATISQDIVLLAQKYMKNPTEVSAKSHVDPEKLEQVYYDVDDNLKYSLLKHLLESEKAKLVMVFCNTRTNVDFVANNLKFMDIKALPIHGGFSQEKRSRILGEFHAKNVNVLVCTDVAARGLDIKGVSHIYNYDLPNDPKEYIHRIGRTARAGKQGKVINIVTGRDYENFNNILTNDKIKIENKETPYIQRTRIRWMPERKNDRMRRRSSMRHERETRSRDNRFKDRDNRSENRRGSRTDSRRRDSRRSSSYSRDSRSSGRRDSGSRKSYGRDSRSRDSRSSYGRNSRGPRRDNRSSGRRDSRRGRTDSRRSDNKRSYSRR